MDGSPPCLFGDAGMLRASPYGDSMADLELDFAAAPRPELVTRLLVLHLHPPGEGAGAAYPEEEIWDWALPRRSQGLLAITAATRGTSAVLELRCTAAGCGESLDLELDLAMFQGVVEPEVVRCTPEPGRRLELRLPRGSDQRSWLQAEARPESDAGLLARSLVLSLDGEAPAADWTLPDAWLTPIGEALEEEDPLNAPRLEAVCPECGSEVHLDLDLEELLLRRLAERQADLMDEVYALAAAFHWTEDEILRLPPSRRRAYLARLAQENDE